MGVKYHYVCHCPRKETELRLGSWVRGCFGMKGKNTEVGVWGGEGHLLPKSYHEQWSQDSKTDAFPSTLLSFQGCTVAPPGELYKVQRSGTTSER